ncbi:uncharacterized protein HD556DRAFT_1247151, partial [Suillus plorans]
SVRKLKRGGALFEVDGPDTKLWLNTPSNGKAFAQEFGGDTTIKDRTFQVIAEYVPISFNLESSSDLREIEERSNLSPGTIVKAKWLKPVARRNPGRRTAFCVIACASRKSANEVIRLGITIEGRKSAARKLLPEPTRCLKCQQLSSSHIAFNCPNKEDTCGTCADTPSTPNAATTNPNHSPSPSTQSNATSIAGSLSPTRPQ